MSAPEDLLAFQLKAVGIPFEREVSFAAPRRWRADFVIPAKCPYPAHGHAPLLIEIDGGTWGTSRHTTGAGFQRDAEKLNAAVLLGYRPLRFTPEMVESGVALQTIEKALAS
jgi:hypothetical protein